MVSANQWLLQCLPFWLHQNDKSIGKLVFYAAVMGSSELEKRERCYLFFGIFLLNLCGSVAAFMVGGWLLFTSQFSYSSSKVVSAFDQHVNRKMPHSDTQSWLIDHAYLILLIVGIFVIILAFFMLWIAIEILILICSKKVPDGKYKQHIDYNTSNKR